MAGGDLAAVRRHGCHAGEHREGGFGVDAAGVHVVGASPDTDFERVRLDRWPVHFILAAGTRDRMTVEIRFAAGDSDVQAVIGKTQTIDSEPDQVIEWDGIATAVFETEVFTAAEAVPLFLPYWQRGRVPDTYALRRIAV